MKNREIESFQLKSSYYKNTWINGNKNHVKEEISELFICNPAVAVQIIVKLPKEIRSAVVKSEQLFKACLNPKYQNF